MKDDMLRKYLDENRATLDSREPSPAVWETIRRRLYGISWYESVQVWRAAAVVLLALCVYLVAGRNLESRQLTQEFTDIEKFYATQLREKASLVSVDELSEDATFTQGMRQLEAMYDVLSDEMKRAPSAKVKDALVLNMLVRIDLLNQQIKKLDDTRKEKEKVSAS